MAKFAYATLLIISLIVCGLAVIQSVPSGIAQTDTPVNGIITQDTTWTKTNSPYTGNVLVANGVMLLIDPGVTVSNFSIIVNGTLQARGSSTEKIIFNGGSIYFTPFSSGWNGQASFGSIIENAVMNGSLSSGGSPMINQNIFGGAISVSGGFPIIKQNTLSGWISVQAGSPVISKNTLLGGWTSGISVSDGNAIISDNTISGSFSLEAIGVGGGSPTIERNLISNNLSYSPPNDVQAGIRISGRSSPIIKQNTITMNLIGIYVDSFAKPTIVNNNIVDNSYSIRLRPSTQVNIDAANNWWGTTDTVEIDEKIWDFNDNFALGKVNYTPFLTVPNAQALPDMNAPVPIPGTSSAQPVSSPGTSPLSSLCLNWSEIALIALLSIIAVLLIVVVSLKKRSVKQTTEA